MGENKGYMTIPEDNGNINISEEVIAAIAVGAVREVEGVADLMAGNNVTSLIGKKGIHGVKILMDSDELVLDLYLMVSFGHEIPAVAKKAQQAVSSTVQDMTGCIVKTVNIHVGGIALT